MKSGSHPLVSVIIPCHNYGKYLEGSVESVVQQSYKNTEIIIINDGSTDGTEKVSRKLISKYTNVRYVYQQNKGIVQTRNRCLKEASGTYMIMLDADDFLDRNYIEETVKIAKEQRLDIVYTNIKFAGNEKSRTDFTSYSLEELKNRNHIHISSLLRTELAKKYKFDINLENKTHEDWDFFLGMCLEGASTALCSTTFLNYRIHSGGRNNRADSDRNRSVFIETYLYIIKKHEKNYPQQFNYLSGKQIGEWFMLLYANLQNHIEALSQSERERLKVTKERDLILKSRSYKVANKLSQAFNFVSFKK